MKTLLITGPQIYTEQGVFTDAALLVQKGLIAEIDSAASFKKDATVQHFSFPANYHVVPGFIDLHTHGASNCDVMDASADALATISQTLAAEGTTAFLATTMTAETKKIEAALVAVRDFMQSPPEKKGAAILGVHLEGPFIAPSKMGAQQAEHIVAPNVALMQHWVQLAQGIIKLVTLAPEQPQSLELIAYLKAQKIIASLGHTNATYAEAMRAIEAGCSHATHLFNAMRGIQQREPGTVTAALLSDKVMTEIIVDGFHLHPAIVQLVLRVKGTDRIVLVTDAMRAKCMQEGCFDLGGQAVRVEAGAARLADGTLAGSVLQMSSALKNMLRFTGCELVDVLKMTSANPAKALGLFERKGSLAVNKDADIVVLDEQLRVVLTVVSGEVVYQAE